ncbi:Homeodomain-like DNA binding domain-containing transcription factor, partial [Phycomyces blakesleeanus NRRL 1555(-)]
MDQSGDSAPSVRKRTRATADQLAVLEDTFAVNVSPNSKLRKQLAEQLQMSERSIQIWFQNRRAKVKHIQKRAQMKMHHASIRAQL